MKKSGFLFLLFFAILFFAILVYAVTISIDTQAEFDNGTYNYTNFTGTSLQLLNSLDSDRSLPINQDESSEVNMSGNVILSYFNESSGNVQDYSGNGNTGTAYDLGYGTVGIINDSFTFDGTNDAIDYGDIEMGSWTDMSISIWFKTTSDSDSHRLVSKDRQGAPGNFMLWMDNTGMFGIWAYDTTEWRTALIDRDLINDGAWHHTVAVVDNSANKVYLYIDGDKVAEDTYTSSTLDDSDNEELVVGAESTVPTFNQGWAGDADEFALWNRSLSAVEVSTLYDKQGSLLGLKSQGDYISEVLDAGSSTDWQYLTAFQTACFACPLPNLSQLESADYYNFTVNMNDTIFMYHFDETSFDSLAGGTDFYDAGGNYYHADANGTVTLGDGILGGGIHLDGSNSNSITVGNLNFSNISELTMTSWVNTSVSDKMRVLSKDQEGETGNFLFRSGNGAGFPDFLISDGGSYDTLTSTIAIDDGKWHHFAAVVNPTLDYSALYIDGVQVANSTFSAHFLDDDPARTVQIGSDSDPGATRTQVHNGGIDEVAMIARAFTDDEILALYHRGTGREIDYQIQSCDDDACSGETFTDVEDSLPINISTLTDNQYIQFQVIMDNNFYSQNMDVLNVSLTDQEVISGLEDGTSWSCPGRCRAASEAPGTTPPGTPVLVSIANGSSGTDRTPRLEWDSSTAGSEGATTYNLQIATDEGFSSLVLDVSSIAETNSSQTEYNVSVDLPVDDIYYWRVAGTDGTGTSEWSDPHYQFEVLSYLALTLPTSSVNFSSMLPLGTKNTTGGSGLQPLIIRNDGNIPVNITVNATAFFVNEGGNYSFFIEENETGAYDSSLLGWINMTFSALQAITDLFHENDTNAANTANLHLLITVPQSELAGEKNSTIEISTS